MKYLKTYEELSAKFLSKKLGGDPIYKQKKSLIENQLNEDLNSFKGKKITFYFNYAPLEAEHYRDGDVFYHMNLDRKTQSIQYDGPGGDKGNLSLAYLDYIKDTDSFQVQNIENRLFSVDKDTANILAEFAKTINPDTEITSTNIKINNYNDLKDKLVSKTSSETLPIEDIDYSIGSDGKGDGKEYKVNIEGKEYETTIGLCSWYF